MKHKILYALPILIALLASCVGKPKVQPALIPSGTFTGQFRLLQRSSDTQPFDTTAANIVITFQTPANTYTVTGDTSTAHAGSYGNFAVNGSYIIFNDKTFPKNGIATKTHLNGLYQFQYDGNILQMKANALDTLSLQYDLKKSQ
jgi:hypothetical protein